MLWPNHDMLLRPRYGRIGGFALPYLWLFELLAPVIELGCIVTIILAASLGVLRQEFFVEFLLFGYAFATVISSITTSALSRQTSPCTSSEVFSLHL